MTLPPKNPLLDHESLGLDSTTTTWFSVTLRNHTKRCADLLGMRTRDIRRLIANPDPHVYARLIALLMIARIGGTGTFIDVRPDGDTEDEALHERCVACGCRSFVSFCGDWIEVGNNSFCDMDADKFECALCTATFTRRELCGEKSYQDQKKRIAQVRREEREGAKRRARK